jgi:hypothetical protein
MRRFLNHPALRTHSIRNRSCRSRPRVEELESRTVLSVFTPAQISHAYGFDQIAFSANGKSIAANGSGQTIAIVDAYNDPSIVSDLQHFDSTFGLPNPTLTKATPQGLPATNAGWSLETALDVEWAHAIAPGANILLVEAASSSLNDLLGAVNYARQQTGVVAVSMSWAGSEFPNEAAFDKYFTTPSGHLGGSSGLAGSTNLAGGITFIASSGDNGAGAMWPAVSPNVVSVGGTTLKVLDTSGTYGSEKAWSGSGGGTSSYEQEPGFQNSVQTTGMRSTPDVAFDGNPNTGVFVYNTAGHSGGWYDVGGTSVGAPQMAGLVAIADQGRALQGKGSLDGPSQTLYALYDIAQTSGTFHSPSGAYNLSTGLGSPQADLVVRSLVNASGSGAKITVTAPVSSTATAAQTPAQTKKSTATPQDINNGAVTPTTVLILVPVQSQVFYTPGPNVHITVDPTAVALPPVDQSAAPRASTSSSLLNTTALGSGGGDNSLFGNGDNNTNSGTPANANAPAGGNGTTPNAHPPMPVPPPPDEPPTALGPQSSDAYFASGLAAGEGSEEDADQQRWLALEPGAAAFALAFVLGGFWRGPSSTTETEERPQLKR